MAMAPTAVRVMMMAAVAAATRPRAFATATALPTRRVTMDSASRSPRRPCRVVDSSVRDERGDEITFVAANGPQHVHSGEPIALTGSGCPDVFKYAYLMDAMAPAFGSENAANPIHWRFSASGSAITTDYRIRSESATVLDWTPLAANAGGNFEIDVLRSGPSGVVELASIGGRYFVDFRARDDRQREAIATGCWNHHPLAAPIEVRGMIQAATADAVGGFSLAANSPISPLLKPSAGVPVFESRVIHSVAEPVKLRLEVREPTGTYKKLAITDMVPESTQSVLIGCGTICRPNSACTPEPETDERCKASNPFDPFDTAEAGELSAGGWTVRVLDTRTNQIATDCAVTGLTVECALAPRRIGGAPTTLAIQLLANNHRELGPSATSVDLLGEHALQGLTYTGLPILERKFRCDSKVTSPFDEFGEAFRTCRTLTTFAKLVALDSLAVTWQAPVVAPVETAVLGVGPLPSSALEPPAYITGPIRGSDFVWNAGNDELPGPAH